MKGLFRAFILLFVSAFFFQCQKDLSYIGHTDPGVLTGPDPITAKLQGNVYDENNLPASGVTVTVGTQTATTDSRGYFRIIDAALDKKSALVVAEKNGYFKGYRVFEATSGTNQVVIKLIKKNLIGTISGASGGEVSLSNGGKILLPANGVVVASNSTAYTGTVNVYASYIDPTANDIAQTVPGSFMADDKNNKRVSLSSYGMMAVELQSATGEKLQIKSGLTSTLTTPIPSAALASAPATIALWSVDEQTGIWKEDGTATKQGSNYVGDVKHYSFWNCDVSAGSIHLYMTIKNNADSLPLVHALVRITRTSTTYTSSAYGYTDSLGQVSGLVPSNEALVLAVLDPCQNVIYTQNIGPFTQNTNLGTIYVSGALVTTGVVTIKGKILSCGGANVTNGFALITINNQVHYAGVDANGNFSTNYTVCSGSAGTAQIIAVDGSGQQQSSATSITLVAPITNAGNLIACGTSAAQFINYTLDGTSYTLSSSDSLIGYGGSAGTSNGVSIMGNQNTPAVNSISFSSNANAAGIFPVTSLRVQNYNQTTLISPFNVTFTTFPASVGLFYEGSLSGNFKDAANVTHTVSATFRVRRIF